MTDGTKPKRAARRRRTTRRLSRKPIRVPVDEVPRSGTDDVEVEVDFDDFARSSAPPARDMVDEDLEQDGDAEGLAAAGAAAPSYEDDALPLGGEAAPTDGATGHAFDDDDERDDDDDRDDDEPDDEGDEDDDVEEDRVTDPDIAVDAGATTSVPDRSVPDASGPAHDDDEDDDDGDEPKTNPRIELTAEMVAAAGRVTSPSSPPGVPSDDGEPDATTDPRIEIAAFNTEPPPRSQAPLEPSVIVAPARFISEPPPPRRSSVPPTAGEGDTEEAARRPGPDGHEDDSLVELDFEDGSISIPPLAMDGADEPAPPVTISKAPPPPPPSKKQRSKGPPPPPGNASRAPEPSASRAPVKQARGWWMDLFTDEYLQTINLPTDGQVERQCDFIVATLGLKPGSAVLDVGCGLGSHALELARRGCLVVGLDLSLSMVTRAAETAQERGLPVNFLHADMRDMEFEGTFDAVLCLGTSFGFFDDDANTDTLRRLHRALRPGGRLLLDVVNRDFVIGSQPNLVWFEGVGCVCMEESDFNYFSSRLFVKRTVMHEDGRQSENEYSLRLYSLHELGQLMQHRGFKVIEVSGLEATRGIFFGNSSPRLIILGERRLHDVD